MLQSRVSAIVNFPMLPGSICCAPPETVVDHVVDIGRRAGTGILFDAVFFSCPSTSTTVRHFVVAQNIEVSVGSLSWQPGGGYHRRFLFFDALRMKRSWHLSLKHTRWKLTNTWHVSRLSTIDIDFHNLLRRLRCIRAADPRHQISETIRGPWRMFSAY